jgi:RNA recognition motif-containing protein
MAQTVSPTTLFVSNLPFDTTNKDLEELFSNVAPVKSCFVVMDKASGQCRGVGEAHSERGRAWGWVLRAGQE